MAYVFTLSFLLLSYIYIGYPLLVFIISRFVHKPVRKEYITPSVTLSISAYNEEGVIEEKIRNALALEYPKELLEIVVVSDGSTDSTDAIVRKYADQGVVLLRIEGRKGKTYCQNELVKQAKGDVIVFSDANSMYHPRAINELVANFADEKVGVVCGELRYIKNTKSTEGVYWGIETFIKQCESRIDSCLGANGAIYAVRKELFVPLAQHAQGDFIEPFFVYQKGFRVIYDATAYCTERPGSPDKELERKERIIIGALESIGLIREMLNPFLYGWYSFTLWSHKVIRWFTFIPMLTVLCSNLYLSLFGHYIFTAIFGLQVLFYLFAYLGKYIRWKPFSIPHYFVLLQIASLVGTRRVLRGDTATTWESSRL